MNGRSHYRLFLSMVSSVAVRLLLVLLLFCLPLVAGCSHDSGLGPAPAASDNDDSDDTSGGDDPADGSAVAGWQFEMAPTNLPVAGSSVSLA